MHLGLFRANFYAFRKSLISNKESKKLDESFYFLGYQSKLSFFVLKYKYFFSKYRTKYLNELFLDLSSTEIEKWLNKNVVILKSEVLEAIKKHSGPVVLVTPHYGPFAAGCLKMSLELKNFKHINTFYDPPEKNSSTEPYKEILSSLGYNFTPIYNDKKGVIKAVKALRNGELLTMMPDVYTINAQSVLVPFFNRLTFAMTGTAYFALKTEALVVHGYARNCFNGKVKIHMDEPYIAKPSIQDNDFYHVTAGIIKSLERQLKKHPEHWMYLDELPSRLDIMLEQNNLEMIEKLATSLGIDL